MIDFRGVGKTYRSPFGKAVRAVEGFTLEIRPGEVMGLAGPNGAGKSTLIALLLGYLAPSEGEVRVDGLSPRRYVERHGVGYLSELVTINPRWRTDDALTRFAVLAGIPEREVAQRVTAVIERLGLDEHRRKAIKALSKGNLQRVGLAQALLQPVRVLVLDEPTHGLDPVWTQRFRDVVDELRRPDRAILIASHNLDELQRLADRVAIIDHGRLQRVVDVRASAAAHATARWRLEVASGAELVAAELPEAVSMGNGTFELPATDVRALNAALARLLARGVLLTGVAPTRTALEQQFREAVGEAEER